MVDYVGCWGVQTKPTLLSNNVGFQYQARNYGVVLITRTKMLYDTMKSLNKVKTSSNIVQHLSNMFDCAVQTGQTCCVQPCLTNMFDPFDKVCLNMFMALNIRKVSAKGEKVRKCFSLFENI